MRRWIGVLAVLLVLAPAAAAARATELPLGPRFLSETRHTQTMARGLTYTDIRRGQTTPDQFFVVDVGLTQDRPQAQATADGLRAGGHQADVLAVDAQAPDTPDTGPFYTVRSGRYATLAEAQAGAAEITAPRRGGDHRAGVPRRARRLQRRRRDPHRRSVARPRPRRRPASVPWLGGSGARQRRRPRPRDALEHHARTGALAGINGGYFVIGAADGTPGDLAGLSVIGGDLISEGVSERTDQGTSVTVAGWPGRR